MVPRKPSNATSDRDVHRQHATLHIFSVGQESEKEQQESEYDRNECVPEVCRDVAADANQCNQDPEDHRKLSHIDLQDR